MGDVAQSSTSPVYLCGERTIIACLNIKLFEIINARINIYCFPECL